MRRVGLAIVNKVLLFTGIGLVGRLIQPTSYMIFVPGRVQEHYTAAVCFGLVMIAIGVLLIAAGSLILRKNPNSVTTIFKTQPVSITEKGFINIRTLSVISAVLAGFFLVAGAAFLYVSFVVGTYSLPGDDYGGFLAYLALRLAGVVFLLIQCIMFSVSASKVGSLDRYDAAPVTVLQG